MKEFYKIIEPSVLSNFEFSSSKELCNHVAGGNSYKIVENYFDSSENATKVTVDVPAFHKEISVYVQKVSVNCELDFCI